MARPRLDIHTGNIVTMVTSLDNYDITMNGDPNNPAGLILDNGGENIINSFSVGLGPTAQFQEGVVTLDPGATMELKHGINVNQGALLISTPIGGVGGSITLDGKSILDNGSEFNAFERNSGGVVTLNGSLTLSHASAANFNFATVQGHGTINIEGGSAVGINTLLAGLHADVGRTASLTLLQPNNAGTINEANGAYVVIENMAAPAASEVFHTASATMDLFSATGAQVAQVQFAHGSREYAFPTTVNGAATSAFLTTSPNTFQGSPPSLPVTFVH